MNRTNQIIFGNCALVAAYLGMGILGKYGINSSLKTSSYASTDLSGLYWIYAAMGVIVVFHLLTSHIETKKVQNETLL